MKKREEDLNTLWEEANYDGTGKLNLTQFLSLAESLFDVELVCLRSLMSCCIMVVLSLSELLFCLLQSALLNDLFPAASSPPRTAHANCPHPKHLSGL